MTSRKVIAGVAAVAVTAELGIVAVLGTGTLENAFDSNEPAGIKKIHSPSSDREIIDEYARYRGYKLNEFQLDIAELGLKAFDIPIDNAHLKEFELRVRNDPILEKTAREFLH